MSKLQDLIQELCPNGVEYKKLGDKEVSIMQRGTSLTKKDSIEGVFPVISGGKIPAFYCDQFNRNGETITVAGSGAGAGYVQYWNEPIFVCDAFSIKGTKSISTKYLYYCLINIQDKIYATKKGGGVPHVHISSIDKFEIPVPPLPVQEEIVRILDHFTNLTAELQAELQARKEQYEYYRDRLFDLELGIYKLSDICIVIGDGLHGTPNYKENGDYFFINGNNLVRGKITLSNQTKRICYEEFCKYSFKFNSNTVFLSINGTIGNVALYNNEQIALGKSVAYFVINPLFLNVKFLYHYLQSKYARNYFESNSTGSTIKNLGLKALRNMSIPVPSIAEQQRIVSILDKFDTLVNDLSQGLPAEIAAVQEQYEYYRNELLSFQKITET